MSNSGVNVFSKQVRIQDLGQSQSNAGDLQWWSIIKDFLSIGNFHVEICVQFWCQRFLKTCEVS